MKKIEVLTEKQWLDILDQIYAVTLNGVPKVSKPVSEFADEYLEKYKDSKIASQKLVNNQILKCTTSGFLTGLGGVLTIPIALPANITSVIYVQMRMIAAVAYLNGYELNSDETQTFVYACLAGVSLNKVVKQTAVVFGVKVCNTLVKKLPGKVLTKINQKVGFRLFTKFGSKGLVNLGKLVPVVGGVIGGTLDFAETKVIANRAIKWFVENDFSDGKKDSEEIVENIQEDDIVILDSDFEVVE